MGNTVCTDAVPFTLDDVLLSQRAGQQRSVRELLTPAAVERFARYQHNMKAFVFYQRAVDNSAARMDPSHVYSLPVSLSQARLRPDETAVYVLVHVQRTPEVPVSARRGGGSTAQCATASGGVAERPLREAEMERRRSSEETPLWVSAVADAFTPRGVAVPFATDIGKPMLVLPSAAAAANTSSGLVPGVDGFDFRYSVHILTGTKANPIVASVAVLHAFRIERCLMDGAEVVQRLFFNYNACRCAAEGKIDIALCAPVGEVVGSRTPRRSPRITDEYGKIAILRILHQMRVKPSLPTIATTPTSARGNMSRGSTPRGKIGTPTALTPYSFYQQQQQPPMTTVATIGATTTTTTAITTTTPTVAATPAGQGPPVLEIPRLRFTVEASRQHAMEPALNAPRRSNTQTPQTTQREANSSQSNAASSRTPLVTSASPRFPAITNLRLNEVLNGRNTSELASDADEIRMTEERLQKLKAASPQATEILPWLFVGGEEAACDRPQLLAKGITAVVNTVAFAMGNVHDEFFHYLSLYVSDSPDEPIFSLFPVVIRFVEEMRANGGKTFIHCHQGVSRSCSFVIAYVMWHEGMCYDRAFEYVRARRTVCSPNAGFYVNLLLWENQLATPVLNKAYVYVPYTEYLFPYSFRLALAFRNHQKSHDDDDSHVVNTFVHTVYEGNDSYVVDPRLSYGILLGERGPVSGGRTPPPIESYFFADEECDEVVRQQAKEDWEAFIKCNFYQGQKKRSINNKGESVNFVPLPRLERPTESLWTVKDVAAVINAGVFGGQRRSSSGGSRLPKPVLAHDRCWDSLLARSDVVFSFAKHLAEEQRVRLGAGNRKRMRDEERRRASKTMVAGVTPRLSPHSHNSAVALKAATSTAVGGGGGTTAASLSSRSPGSGARPTVPLRKGPGSTPSSPGSHSPRHEVEIYAYPFTGSPLPNIFDISDMEAGRCYVVIVPATTSTTDHHRVFLWMGCKCSVGEAEAWQAYQRSLKAGKDVRLWSGMVLKGPVEEVVHDGEEPDDLLLALD
ncbi:putative dual specificity protein phosphatase [Trypanosoma grayi]|uniref:putative dual specificity protein phosphatase n=1 Tax=Trypanosoma grayi TaxID=71804 RepID=UPI0004F42954|nr:putative dual specificity protein phosphatase [Trypanosoma grayi]KEG11211.1 putative dual specificity protein phosphatase [Trypanosoma grayi]